MTTKKRRWVIGESQIVKGSKGPAVPRVQQYLTEFGYLTEKFNDGELDEATSYALATFQETSGLEPTGEVDIATVQEMEALRCEASDDFGLITTLECRLGKRSFTYRFMNGTNDISGQQKRQAIRNVSVLQSTVSLPNLEIIKPYL